MASNETESVDMKNIALSTVVMRIGPQILSGLGIDPKNVTGFTMHFRAAEPVTVRVDYVARQGTIRTEWVADYVLVPREKLDHWVRVDGAH